MFSHTLILYGWFAVCACDLCLIQASALVTFSRKSAGQGLETPGSILGSHDHTSCFANITDVDSDQGGRVVVHMTPLEEGAQLLCTLGLAWDGWVLTSGNEHEDRHMATVGSWRNGGSEVICEIPPFPEAGEGPVELHVGSSAIVNGSNITRLCRPIPLWYSTRLVASFSETPYFAADSGELLVRTNATSMSGPLRLRASGPDGQSLLDATVSVAARAAFSVPFQGLDPAFNGTIRVELLDSDSLVAERLVRLVRVPERLRGRSSVDHKRRSLLVDGRPFFPIGWFSTYLSFGETAAASSLVDMARSGVNSIMLYSLVGGPPGSAIFHDRGTPPSSPGPLLDAAAALGIKVQVYLLDMTRPLSNGNSSYWRALEEVVLAWRHHPAVLSWYIADDGAGPFLPDVYRRIKQLDPHHIVTMAIAGSGDAYRVKYTEGSDVIMVETYPTSASFPYATMNVISRWPLEFMPSLTCGRAWSIEEDYGIITPEVFRSQLYHALIAGATGEVWFAFRNAKNWNNPGLSLAAAALEASQQLLDLAPALLSPGSYAANSTAPAVAASAALMSGAAAGPAAVRARAFSEETGCVTLLIANGLNEPVKASVHFAYGSLGIFDEGTNETEALVPFELALPPRRVPVKQGVLVEWLPASGVQAFRLNGISSCAVPEISAKALERSNLVFNPSFEQFGAYMSSLLHWDCGMSPLTTSSCFADASVRKDRRHAGRFVTGLDAAAFLIKPSIGWSEHLPRLGLYKLSIWAQAEVPMVLQAGLGGETFEELARMELAGSWRQLQVEVKLPRHAPVVFKVNTTGVLWLDDMQLGLKQIISVNKMEPLA